MFSALASLGTLKALAVIYTPTFLQYVLATFPVLDLELGDFSSSELSTFEIQVIGGKLKEQGLKL